MQLMLDLQVDYRSPLADVDHSRQQRATTCIPKLITEVSRQRHSVDVLN